VSIAVPAASAPLWWNPRRSRVLLVATAVPFLIVAPLATAVGLEEPPRSGWLVLALTLGIGLLHLRHSFSTARGSRPPAWRATLIAVGLLVYVPMPWFAIDWASMQWMFIASAAMLVHRRVLTVILVAAPILGTAVWMALEAADSGDTVVGAWVYTPLYWAIGLAGGVACLYGTPLLVRAVDELFATRVELAHSAVRRERVRLSRDLHDLLGQSLAAIALKGDLALALVHDGSTEAALGEVRAVTAVAHNTLHDMRRVIRGEHPVELEAELEAAGELLAAASVEIHVEAELSGLTKELDELFGWAVREGVTNMLRHSQAAHCSITVSRDDSGATLEIVNDGAAGSEALGTGLSGLAERAELLSGRVVAGLQHNRFRVCVEVPEARP
jgi:two-component system sensor histidine kinase DesK